MREKERVKELERENERASRRECVRDSERENERASEFKRKSASGMDGVVWTPMDTLWTHYDPPWTPTAPYLATEWIE